jgi:hypothetical protein
MIHAALNLTTGEVLTANRSTHLKRRVARIAHYDITHGYGASKWIFAHGENWADILAAKCDKHFGHKSL